MTGRLYPTLPMHTDETLTGYVSRLAVLHRLPTALRFCQELGFSFRGLCRGDPTAIERFAALVEEPIETLRDAAFIGRDDRWIIRGESFCWPALRRSSFAFCPACLQHDAVGAANPQTVAYERSAWAIAAFQTCPTHAIALTVVPGPRYLHDLRDFARHTRGVAHGPEAIDGARHRPATGLEHYIARRFSDSGPAGESAFDPMPLSTVIRACEVFGTAAVFGPSRMPRSLQPEERVTAAGVGFDMLRRGRDGIDELLDRIRTTYTSNKISSNRPSVIYDKLYIWLYHSCDPAYDAIKSDVFEHIAGHSEINVSKKLFGQPVANRPWSSIRKAHVATGIDPPRLRRILAASGLISAEVEAKPYSHIVVPASDLNALIREMQDSVGWDGLKGMLGVSRRTAEHFVGPSLIEPLVSRGMQSLKSDIFRRSDIQRFIDSLMTKAVPVKRPSATMVPLLSAYRKTMAETQAIVSLVVQDRLAFLGQRSGKTGIASLLVDIAEVRKCLHFKDRELTLKGVSAEMKIHPAAIRNLISLGYLRCDYIGNPFRKRPVRSISAASVDEFQSQYVTQFQIRNRTHLGYEKIVVLAARHGLTPVCPVEDVGIAFYRREDVEKFLAALATEN